MARPAISWLTTDTHFFHDFMLGNGRPADFGERLLKNMRHLLAAQDTLYHLGDVIFYQYPKLKGMLDSIPGTKVLLMGNHDKKSKGWFMKNGFVFAADMIVVDDILLSHKPVEKLPSGVRMNVHGHWHHDDHHRRPEWYSESTHRLLSVEATNYKPVKFKEFVR
jgi:calcineurin-like phosphoesterase family protein